MSFKTIFFLYVLPGLIGVLIVFAAYQYKSASVTPPSGLPAAELPKAGALPELPKLPAAPKLPSAPSLGYELPPDDSPKYESRSGSSGSYSYNYDVSGYGDGGYVYGNVDVSGKYGEGYIYNENGDELYVDVEWVDNGVLEAYDEEGNWYELEVD